jgi:hypothetical protein
VLTTWVHANRLALSRMDEPEEGIGRPQIRIVRARSKASHEDGRIVRLEPSERIVLPYDIR